MARKIIPLSGARKIASDRIKQLGLDQKAVSLMLGRNDSYIHQWLSYGTPKVLPEGMRKALARALDIDEFNLMSEDQQHDHYMQSIRVVPPYALDQDDLPKDTLLRRRPGEIIERDVRASLGIGGAVQEVIANFTAQTNRVATWVFPSAFVHNELRSREADLDIIIVDGRSMEPILNSGDRVVIDRSLRQPSSDGLFLIHDGLGLSIKRLDVVTGSDPLEIEIVPENRAFPVRKILASDLHVVGRVICRITLV